MFLTTKSSSNDFGGGHVWRCFLLYIIDSVQINIWHKKTRESEAEAPGLWAVIELGEDKAGMKMCSPSSTKTSATKNVCR